MTDIKLIINQLEQGDFRMIAKAISMVENELSANQELLLNLKVNPKTKVLGITGPPGAGKSTLINALLYQFTTHQQKVAVLSVDPSSPFNFGALLGDRIRMSSFYLNPNVFIRSMASRGSLGGLNAKIVEVIDVLRAAQFDYILVETVGVGQSEVEIAGIADTTIVVMVPEAGDEVQTMKAGIMEIADIFVVNKSDRPHADEFIKNLKILAHSKANEWETPVVKCVASEHTGIDDLEEAILKHQTILSNNSNRKSFLLSEKAFLIIQQHRMQDIDRIDLHKKLETEMNQEDFNIYKFARQYY